MMAVRSSVSKQLEQLRNDKVIKGSLTAQVTLYCDGDLYDKLARLEDELRFVLITSDATLKSLAEKSDTAVESELTGLWLDAGAAEQPKCARCWHHREDVGRIQSILNCANVVWTTLEGDGEVRHYA